MPRLYFTVDSVCLLCALVACCSLLVARLSLLVACRSSLVAWCLLLVACRLLLVALPVVACFLLLVACRSLLVARCVAGLPLEPTNRERDVPSSEVALPSAPRSPESTPRDVGTPRDAETIVEIGPDGGTREWRVGTMEIVASGELEREWGLGRV